MAQACHHHRCFTRLLGSLVCSQRREATTFVQMVPAQGYHTCAGTAAALQQQWPSPAAAASESLLQPMQALQSLPTQQSRSKAGLQEPLQPHSTWLSGPAAAKQQKQYHWQRIGWRGCPPRFYHTGNSLQNNVQTDDNTGREPNTSATPNGQQPGGEPQQPLDSNTAFIHGIHSSHEPPIHDLHYRISQVKPKPAAAASGTSSNIGNGLDPQLHAGFTPDGEYDSSSGSTAQELSDEDALSSVNTDASSGALRLRFRRKTPLFQVIEFQASGTAIEEYRERNPHELGLHPRDVTLFAPLSRLAAPQRATIAVHDGKILVKTEVVKAIITPEKAVLIKSRRQRDTQKIAQAILAANDQRLMAIKLWQHQQQEIKNISSPIGPDSCRRAASAADLLMQHSQGVQSRAGKQSARLTYSAPAGYVQMLSPGPAASSSPSISGAPGQRNSGHIIEPAATGDTLRRTAGGSFGSDLKDVPFEMLVLEVLLDATTEYFYTKVQHLNWMLESIGADIRQPGQVQGAIDKAHQLIPIQKFLSSLKNDVKETCAAVQTALEDDETLQEWCLSWHAQQRSHTAWSPIELQHHKPGGQYHDANGVAYSPAANGAGLLNDKLVSSEQQVRMISEMLESYEREIQSLEGSINEAEEDLDNTRALWHMQLDSSRNHIIMVNLWLSMLNISVMATTILPAFFGMNLHSGLSEEDPNIFLAVCSLSVLVSALSYPLSRYWYNRNWRKINENELYEQKMLRVLLVQNIDDVDDIIRALRRHSNQKMDRKMFREVVFQALGNRAMTQTHIDFLWRCFDRNQDGFLEEAEMIKPLNTYHASNTYDNSLDSRRSRDTSANGLTPAEYLLQQAKAGPLPAQGLPHQLGSLEGLRSRSNQLGVSDDAGQNTGQRDPVGYSGTLRAPAGKVQSGSVRVKAEKEDSWMDDDRFKWD